MENTPSKKRVIASINNEMGAQYDPIEDLDPVVKAKILQMPEEQQTPAVQQAIDQADAFTRIKAMLKSGYYGNKRTP